MTITHCPNCNADFRGEEIPEAYSKWHTGETHYSRIIGHVSTTTDAMTGWECPDCGHRWPRNNKPKETK